MEPLAGFLEGPPAAHLGTLAVEPLFAPFVRRVLAPLVESEGDLRWGAKAFEWGTVLRVHTGATTLDFVFWAEEIRFSFFVGTREDMDEFLRSPEQSESAAAWLREFLSHPFGIEDITHPALLSPS